MSRKTDAAKLALLQEIADNTSKTADAAQDIYGILEANEKAQQDAIRAEYSR